MHMPRHGTRLILFLLVVLLCVATAEVTARAFWRLSYGIPLGDPGRILYSYYQSYDMLTEPARIGPKLEMG
jgi:hypothetical protein